MVTEMAMQGEPWRRPEEEQAAADRDRELELELFRSGSAPPTVEGSTGALHGTGADVFLEDELRADTAYHSYYYSNGNANPRLPPPLLSKEDWRSAQRLRSGSGLGGIGDGRKPRGGGGGVMGPGDGLGWVSAIFSGSRVKDDSNGSSKKFSNNHQNHNKRT